jgi:MATE family multidrug resistance protein
MSIDIKSNKEEKMLIDNLQTLQNQPLYKDEKELLITTKDAMKEISVLAFPTMLFFSCIFLQQTIALAFVGRKFENNDKDIIDGIGISNLYINCCVFSIAIGLISGMETLCSNAFGVKNNYLIGVYIHRARFITLIFVLVLTVFNLFFAVEILRLFSIDENVIYYSTRYIKVSMFYVLIDVFFSINFRFLNIIEKSYINLIVLIISICLHPLWCWIFINVLNLDALGSAISLVISQSINTVLTSLYIWIMDPLPGSIFWPNNDCFKGWWEYLKFTFPSMFLTCAEWWAFEIQAIIAINISKLDYAVHVLIYSINSILYTISIGFGMAATILIGKHITESNTYTARKVAKLIFIYGNIVSLILSSSILFMGSNLLRFFVEDEEIIEKGSPILYLLFAQQIFDISQTIIACYYRGLGKQLMASIIAFVNFYLIQTALSVLFGIVLGMGVLGMWLGIGIGCFITFFTYLATLRLINLKDIRQETLQRLENDKTILDIDE